MDSLQPGSPAPVSQVQWMTEVSNFHGISSPSAFKAAPGRPNARVSHPNGAQGPALFMLSVEFSSDRGSGPLTTKPRFWTGAESKVL